MEPTKTALPKETLAAGAASRTMGGYRPARTLHFCRGGPSPWSMRLVVPLQEVPVGCRDGMPLWNLTSKFFWWDFSNLQYAATF